MKYNYIYCCYTSNAGKAFNFRIIHLLVYCLIESRLSMGKNEFPFSLQNSLRTVYTNKLNHFFYIANAMNFQF